MRRRRIEGVPACFAAGTPPKHPEMARESDKWVRLALRSITVVEQRVLEK